MKVDIRNIKLVRRDVLKLSAAAVVGPPLVGATLTEGNWFSSQSSVDAIDESASPRVSIGYWDGLLASSFVDAREIPEAEAQLERGAWVRLSGSYDDETAAAWSGFGSVSLSFDMKPFHDGMVQAWHYQSSPVTNISSVTALSLPVDRGTGLSGWVTFRDAAPNALPARVPFHLAMDASRGHVKLRSGYYVIALSDRGSRGRVSWDSVSLTARSGGNALALSERGGHRFDRPHIIVEVDTV